METLYLKNADERDCRYPKGLRKNTGMLENQSTVYLGGQLLYNIGLPCNLQIVRYHFTYIISVEFLRWKMATV